MAKGNTAEPETIGVVKEVKKPYRVLSGIVLGDQVSDEADRATKRLTPHKQHRKGSIVELNKKDAKDLLALKVVEPVK